MAATKAQYALPCRKQDLIVAISDPRAHFAHFKHAIDFLLPEGSVIRASRAGVVVDSKINSHEGGIDPKYNDMTYLNFLTIRHAGGEFSQYAHLRYRGALVRRGVRVWEGQPIALSGNTGFSTAPHLHFLVFKLARSELGWESLKIRFKEPLRVRRKPGPVTKAMAPVLKEIERTKRALRRNTSS